MLSSPRLDSTSESGQCGPSTFATHFTPSGLRRWTAAAEGKYPYARDFELMALERMVLFDNADRDVQPDLIIDVPRAEVRAFFVAEAKMLVDEWFAEDADR